MLRCRLSCSAQENQISFNRRSSCKGLLVGVSIDPSYYSARICVAFDEKKVCLQTHKAVIRLAPPLVITEQLDAVINAISETLTEAEADLKTLQRDNCTKKMD